VSSLLTALTRNDIAQYVDSLFLVYIILIFARIVLSWVIAFRGSLPYNRALRAVTDFIDPPNWPAFNLADIEITVGVALLLLLYMREPEAEVAAAGDPAVDSAGEPDGSGE